MLPCDDLITEIIRREGGFVDRPSDRGGPTCFGITERVANNYGHRGPIQYLPESTARYIYEQRYWYEPHFHLVHAIAERIGVELFDTGVNQGIEAASKYLQRALNAFNHRGKDYPDLAVDGQIGPNTLDALNAFLRQRGREGERVMLAALNCQQGALYLNLAANDVTQEDYVYGWMLNRVVL